MALKRMKVRSMTVVKPRGWTPDFTRRRVNDSLSAAQERRAKSDRCVVIFPASKKGRKPSSSTKPIVRCDGSSLSAKAKSRFKRAKPCVSTRTKKFVARTRTGGCPSGSRPAKSSRKRRR